jgi:UDP:flavonoid glycosyltransferase YjiC (YdhE family)
MLPNMGWVICTMPNCCFLSETTRCLEIYRALVARGAPVRMAVHGGTYEWVLRDAGVPFDVIGPGLDPRRCAEFVASVPGIGRPDQSMWSDEELRSYARAEAEYFARKGIRVVVTGWLLTTLLSTQLTGALLVTDHAGSFLPPVYQRGLLPDFSAPVGLPLERLLPRRLKRWLVNHGVERMTGYTGGFNRVAAELGVAGVPHLPALLLGDLTLVTEVPEVLGISPSDMDGWRPRADSGFRPGARMRYTGPLYARLPGPLPAQVDRFLDGPGPVVYVAITSSPADLVRRAVHSVRSTGARVLVASTVHELADLAVDGVLVEPVLPSHLVMPRVDLAVIAGGQGSVQTAVCSGVPFVGLPLQPEQDTNVVLVERRHAAVRVRPDQAGTAHMSTVVGRMLGDPTYRAAAHALKAVYDRVDGAAEAATAILELAVTHTVHS